MWLRISPSRIKCGSSGKVNSDQSVHVELDGLSVVSRKRYYYRVRTWDQNGETSSWSETAYWETAMLDSKEWSAEWISAASESEQVPLLRKGFEVKGGMKQARLYASALGLYELELNGSRVGDSYFTPGWTSYNHRLQVQTYDVTGQLATGENVIGAMLGNGWYKGNLAWEEKHSIYGDRKALFLQLHIAYEDGTEQVVLSDGSWRTAGSPILMSELYHGETYDARLELSGWSSVGFDDSSWQAVQIVQQNSDILIAQENEPVRKIEEIKPIEMFKTPLGETVLDFGQNMVGWVRFSVTGEAGSTVEINHAEVLDKDGNFYIENMRAAKVTIHYTLKGGERETYEPRFSFQGFRYIRLKGFGDDVRLEDFTGIVLHTDMATTGVFQCSDPLVNQLQHNIEWGLKVISSMCLRTVRNVMNASVGPEMLRCSSGQRLIYEMWHPSS